MSDWYPLHCCMLSHGEAKPPCGQCAYCLANTEYNTLARLLDGVMADDHASIREAAAWLAEHRPLEDNK